MNEKGTFVVGHGSFVGRSHYSIPLNCCCAPCKMDVNIMIRYSCQDPGRFSLPLSLCMTAVALLLLSSTGMLFAISLFSLHVVHESNTLNGTSSQGHYYNAHHRSNPTTRCPTGGIRSLAGDHISTSALPASRFDNALPRWYTISNLPIVRLAIASRSS